MNDFAFNPDAGPIYKQVYQWIKDKIIYEEWLPGEQVPPEMVLSADLNVSRHTVRKALEILMNEGYLYRQPGKGTFINEKKSNYKLSYLYSFTEQMKEMDKVPSSVCLEIDKNIVPDSKLKRRMALSEYERLIRIYRLRLADREPMSLEEVYISRNLAPEIYKKDLESQSIYKILEEEYKLAIDHGDILLGAKAANPHQAELLKVEENSPLVYMDCLTFLENQRPAFLTYAIYPYDRYIFSLKLPRKNG